MKRITRIGVMSAAKIQGAIMGLFGLVLGIVFSLGGVLFSGIVGSPLFAGIGLLALIAFPVMYGIMGFVIGAIVAAIYNLAAGRVGGIEIELEK